MRRTQDISLSRLLVQVKLHMKEEFLIVSYSCQMNTQWSHQRSCSEPRSITQILINWEESAWISSRTSGPQHCKSDQCFSPSRLWCLFQIWMILLINQSPITGRQMKMEPLTKQSHGPLNLLTTEKYLNDAFMWLIPHEMKFKT